MSSLYGGNPFTGNSTGPTSYDQIQDQTISQIQGVGDLSSLTNRVANVESKNVLQDNQIATINTNKADKSYVDSANSVQDAALISITSTITNQGNAINTKADKTYVDENFVLTSTYIPAITSLQSNVASKADKIYVDTTFATKTYVDNAIAGGGTAFAGNYVKEIVGTTPLTWNADLLTGNVQSNGGTATIKKLNIAAPLTFVNSSTVVDVGFDSDYIQAGTGIIITNLSNGRKQIEATGSGVGTQTANQIQFNNKNQFPVPSSFDDVEEGMKYLSDRIVANTTQITSTDNALTNHTNSNAAHSAYQIIRVPANGLTSTTVENALIELNTKFNTLSTGNLRTGQQTFLDKVDQSGTTAPATQPSFLNWNNVATLNQALGTSNNVTFAGMLINGNIQVTGTVDGYDVSILGSTVATQGTDLANHIAQVTDAHDASAISVATISGLPGDDVQECLGALRTQISNLSLSSSNPFSTLEIDTIHNIQADSQGSFSTIQWNRLRSIDQNLSTTSGVRFNNLTVNYVNGQIPLKVSSPFAPLRNIFEINTLTPDDEKLTMYRTGASTPMFDVSKVGIFHETPTLYSNGGFIMNLATYKSTIDTMQTQVTNIGARMPGGINGTVSLAALTNNMVNNLFQSNNSVISPFAWAALANLTQNVNTTALPSWVAITLTNNSNDRPFSISKFNSGIGSSLQYRESEGLKFFSKTGAQSNANDSDLCVKINSDKISMYGLDAPSNSTWLEVYKSGTSFGSTDYAWKFGRDGSLLVKGSNAGNPSEPSFAIYNDGLCRAQRGIELLVNGVWTPLTGTTSGTGLTPLTYTIGNGINTISSAMYAPFGGQSNVLQNNSIKITPVEHNYSSLALDGSIMMMSATGSNASLYGAKTYTHSILMSAGTNLLSNNNINNSVCIHTAEQNDQIYCGNNSVLVGNSSNLYIGYKPCDYSVSLGANNTNMGNNYQVTIGTSNNVQYSDSSVSIGFDNLIFGAEAATYLLNVAIGTNNNIGYGELFGFSNFIRNNILIGHNNKCLTLSSYELDAVNTNSGAQVVCMGNNNIIQGYNSIVIGNDNLLTRATDNRLVIGTGWNFDAPASSSRYYRKTGTAAQIRTPVENIAYIGHVDSSAKCSIQFANDLPVLTSEDVSNYLPVYYTTQNSSTHGAFVLKRATSSIRYKENVIDLDYPDELLEKMRPVEYTMKGSSVRNVGFIAEELAEVDPRICYSLNGEIEGIDYSRVCIIQGVQIKKLMKRIEALEALLTKEPKT